MKAGMQGDVKLPTWPPLPNAHDYIAVSKYLKRVEAYPALYHIDTYYLVGRNKARYDDAISNK